MKIDRLIGILSILLQEEKTTAPELAERFVEREDLSGRHYSKGSFYTGYEVASC